MEKFLALNDSIVFAFDFAQLLDTVLEDFYFLKQSKSVIVRLKLLTFKDYCRFSFILNLLIYKVRY